MIASSLKVDYLCNSQNYTGILQEIDTQIPTNKCQPFSPTGVSEINRIEERNRNRFGGYFPAYGAHMVDGKLYNGSYPYKQWII